MTSQMRNKPSGLQWAETIPINWATKAVWMMFELGRGRVISNEEIADNPGPYPVFSSQTEDSGILGSMATFDFEGEYLTWTTDGARAGTVFLRSGKFNCTNVCGTLKSKTKDIDLNFFCFALNQATHWFVRHDINPKLMNNVMASIRVPVPPFSEQRAIAAYLDLETARLDRLVTAKERLLELLAEKRRSLITHVVTRGLNSGAPLRDSGIPWLGQIPAHWKTRRVAALFRERDERGEPELPLLEVSINAGVALREFSDDRIESTAADFNTYKVARRGDIVFNKMRMWQGAVGVAPEDGLVSPDYTVAEPLEPLSSAYAGQLFRTEMFSAECARNSHGIVWDRLRLYWDGFRDIVLPLPSLEEQDAIVAHIATETAKLDALRAATERTIALLKERRAALIAAAVTGRIIVEVNR